MTERQYWDEDCRLVKYYREADEIRRERRNQELWLQGMYVYEAICDASPVLHAFAKKGTKPQPYAEKPYPITKARKNADKEEKEKAVAEKGKQMLYALMARTNKK